MQVSHSKEIANFHIVGINYKKTDAAIRGLFAINPTQYQQLLERAKTESLDDLFVLSTCNRTEVYGFAPTPDQLIELLSKETIGEKSQLEEIAYIKSGEEAIKHLYQVGTGLDSQILGDYEIIGQIRSASKFAKTQNSLGGFLERLVNSVSQVSKLIKTETGLSKGTVSVAFATVRMIEKVCPDIRNKKIVLVGVGKIGRNTIKNMIEYLGVKQITLINRTLQVAADFAEENGLKYAPYEQLSEELATADVIMVASNAPHPTVLPSHFTTEAPKMIIDLSIPFNVDPAVRELPNITMVNVDELSKVQDETLQNRLGEVPKALAIIEEHMEEFLYWYKMRKHAVVLKAVKDKLQEIHTREIQQQRIGEHYKLEDIELVSSRIIQKMINLMAGKVRKEADKSDQYIAMINDIFETGVNQE
ncbi:glutamyl-tRNA reductase [Chitinophaga silvatica]|uniref:Glutamyl-tRNA reductase n=1 Tax=Chitinophaga silvatica TaxID=2282649 RepID=A0A3E1Y502_9BACT|nr:glutamyl-tRNA reductase [Chitinophaga silvatica]RFS19743.1 glutamyl-tRNA reductase [Chitinophaga silvatica]